MKFFDLEELRNDEGFIDLDKINNIVINEYIGDKKIKIVGRRPKYWITLEDINILFKETTANSYEDYAHLFYSEFANQCGVEHAEYDRAIFRGRKGVITPNFLKKDEKLISGKVLLESAQQIYMENNMEKTPANSVEDAMDALTLFNFDIKLVREAITQLIKLDILDGVLLETDRNSTNWGIITRSSDVRIAPIYDGSNMCGLNRSISDINSKITSIRDLGTLQSLIFNSKRSFFLNKKTMEQPFLQEAQYICQKYPFIIENFIPKIFALNVDLAQKNIEEKIKSEIPYAVILWISKIIKYNLENLEYACGSVQPTISEEKTL